MTRKLLIAVSAIAFAAASGAMATEKKVVPPQPKDIPLITTETPAKVEDAEISYVTGGIGEDERAEIEAKTAEYNVQITNASVDGPFLEDTEITIHRHVGADYLEVFEVDAGPLLYVNLPAGRYTVEAERGKQTKRKDITIGAKSKAQKVIFAWKPVPAAH